jgi:hypothetical protein
VDADSEWAHTFTMAASTLTSPTAGLSVRLSGEHRITLGSKRRKVIGILVFVQAILFGSTTPIGNYSLIQWVAQDPTFGSLQGPGWRLTEGQLGFDQVFALAAAIIVGILVWRGLPFAIYSTAALAAISVVYSVSYTILEFMAVGPRALSFLLFFPLPTVPPGVIAIPVFILTLTVMAGMRRDASQKPEVTRLK